MSSVDDCSSSHNYVNPPTRPPWVQATCIIYLVLVVGTLALRFYTRLRFGHRLGVDDLFAALATVFAVSGYIIVLVMEQHYGFNRHSWDIPPAMYRTVVRLNWIYDELFVQAACQAKLSLLLFCWRLIGRAFQRIHYILVMSLIAFVVLCEIMFVIVSVLECRYLVPPQLAISRENPVADDRSPLKAIWDHHPDYHYSCFKIGYFLMIAGLINTVTDIACTLIPISVVLRLEMPLRQRFGVASVFLLGFIVNVASCLRIYYAYHQEIWGGDIWNQMQPFIASNSEIGLGLLCVNVPVIRPLFTHLLSYASRYTHVYATNGTRRTYRLDQTDNGLNYASDTRITKTKTNDECTGKAFIVMPTDRSLCGGESDREAAAANANSWRATTVELETVSDTRPHHDADSLIANFGSCKLL